MYSYLYYLVWVSGSGLTWCVCWTIKIGLILESESNGLDSIVGGETTVVSFLYERSAVS